MKVKFYKINKKINSTFTPSGGTELDVNLKSPSSIINPVLELQAYGDYNYCYIERFNRYYFINDIRFIDSLWLYSLNVDVLASFKNDIGNSELYVLRSASNYDLTIRDSMYNNKLATSYNYQSLGSYYPTFNDGFYVVSVAGTNLTTGGQIYYQLTPSNFQTLITELFTSADGYQWGDLPQGVINSVMNPMQYITSARWFNQSFSAKSYNVNINAGNWQSSAKGDILSGADVDTGMIINAQIPKHPKASTRGEYLNMQPFTKYELLIGNIGLINIPNEALIGKNYIHTKQYADFITGKGLMKVYALETLPSAPITPTDNEKLIANIEYQAGIPISLTADNTGSGIMQFGLGALQTALGVGFGIPNVAGEGLGGMVSGAVSLIQPSINTKGNVGGLIDYQTRRSFRTTFLDIQDEDLENLGRPCCKKLRINTLSGFVQCETGNIVSNATESEKNSISSYLTTGFFYE